MNLDNEDRRIMHSAEEGASSSIEVTIAESDKDIAGAKEKLIEVLYNSDRSFFNTYENEQPIYVVAKDKNDNNKVIGAGRILLNPSWKTERDTQGTITKALTAKLRAEGFVDDEAIDGHIARFAGIAVDKEYRRHNVGTQLYQIRERIAAERGKRFFYVECRPESRGIYLSNGYKPFGSDQLRLGTRVIDRVWFCKYPTTTKS